MWLRDSTLHDLMADWWCEGKPTYRTAMYSFVKQLQFVKYKLKRCNIMSFGNIFLEEKNSQSRVDSITCQIRDQRMYEYLYKEEGSVVKDLEEWEAR